MDVRARAGARPLTQCLVPGCQRVPGSRYSPKIPLKEGGHWHFCDEHWFALPLEIRRRWWSETQYGKRTPSPELRILVIEELTTGREP